MRLLRRFFFVLPIICSLRFLSISIQYRHNRLPTPGRKKSYYYLLESECHRGTGAHFFNAMRRTKFETIPCTHRPDARASLTSNSTNIGRSPPASPGSICDICVFCSCVCVFFFFFLSLSEAKNSDTLLYSFLLFLLAPLPPMNICLIPVRAPVRSLILRSLSSSLPAPCPHPSATPPLSHDPLFIFTSPPFFCLEAMTVLHGFVSLSFFFFFWHLHAMYSVLCTSPPPFSTQLFSILSLRCLYSFSVVRLRGRVGFASSGRPYTVRSVSACFCPLFCCYHIST